jgi:hypothetical protein
MNVKKPLFNKYINIGNMAEKVKKSTNLLILDSKLSSAKDVIMVAIKRLTERHISLKVFNSIIREINARLM